MQPVRNAVHLIALGAIGAGCVGCREAPPPRFSVHRLETSARLQAVSVVDDRTAWVSGIDGTYARTVDGGATWEIGVVPEAETLQFRDVHAVSADTAYLLAAGTGDASRVYKTTDGGLHWALQFVNTLPDAFFDCFAFWNANAGVAFSDAVDGAFVVIRTEDGIRWETVGAEVLPPAQEGEGGFAASGTCVVTMGDSAAWIGTGNAASARLLHTTDRGRTWMVVGAPVIAGDAAGITGVALGSPTRWVVVGGEIGVAEADTDRVARTVDGGGSWTLRDGPPFAGAVYGAAFADSARQALVAVGPGGAAFSMDDGDSWTTLDTLSWWGVGFRGGSGWLAGPDGRVARIEFR